MAQFRTSASEQLSSEKRRLYALRGHDTDYTDSHPAERDGEKQLKLCNRYHVPVKRKTGNALPQANAYAMIQRRALAAEITTKIGNHTFQVGA
jgi:hypothetical protein